MFPVLRTNGLFSSPSPPSAGEPGDDIDPVEGEGAAVGEGAGPGDGAPTAGLPEDALAVEKTNVKFKTTQTTMTIDKMIRI